MDGFPILIRLIRVSPFSSIATIPLLAPVNDQFVQEASLWAGLPWVMCGFLVLVCLWLWRSRPRAAATSPFQAVPPESLSLKTLLLDSSLGRVEQAFFLTLDERGAILAASTEWRDFLDRYQFDPRLGEIGANFLDLAADPTSLYGDNAITVSRAVGAVISRSTESIRLECRVTQPGSTIVLTVAAFGIVTPAGPGRTILMHVPVLDRLRFQTLLDESEKRYRHLFRLSPLPLLVVDPGSLRIIAANEAAGEFVGRRAKDLDDELLLNLIDAPLHTLQRWIFASERRFETRVKRHDQGHFDAEFFSVEVTFEGSSARLLMVRNLTDQRAAEAATRSREEMLRAVCEAGEWLLEEPNWYSGLSQSKPRLTSAAEAESFILLKAKTPGDALEFYCCWPHLPPDASPQIPTSIDLAADSELFVDLRAGKVLSLQEERQHVLLAPVLCFSSLWGAVALTRSIKQGPFAAASHDSLRTFAGMLGAAIQRDEIQAALRQSDEQLRHAQKMEAIGQLASGVSHDFNNLLTAIQGYITLAKGVLPKDHPAAGSLEQVELAARQATGVANSLLAFSRRSAGERRRAILHTVAEPAIRLLRRSLPSNISLEFRCGEPPVWVNCDPSQIQQVIVALALNAKDAMPQGGKLVVEIDQQEKAGVARARVRVTDTGIGMTPEVQRRVFEPFFTTKPRGEGTGLSLAISHSIVSLHEGEMEVHSEPGKGSTFTFSFPAAEAPFEREMPAMLPQSGVALVVEDNQLVGALVSTILASMGYSPVQAGSVAEAAECLHPEPSVIVVDVELPDIPGTEWVRTLRNRGMHTPVVFITGRSDKTDVSALRPAVSLHKPFQAADLVRVLGSMVAEPSGVSS